MAFSSIPSTSVDAKSPIDDTLMALIKADLDDLDSRVTVAGNSPFSFEINGRIAGLTNFKRGIALGLVNKAFIPSVCRYMLKKSGLSGTLAFDLRFHTMPNTPITGIDHQYTAATSSIAQQGSSILTQSIARATTQIATQSITHAKTAANVQSIINVGGNFWQYNLDVALDSDNLVGDSIVLASCTTGANNGTFTIVEKGRCGGNNFVVSNASGVAQTGVAGTAQPKIMSYNYTNPVNAQFAAGETVVMASHTTGANNGTLTIYKINQSGNNIWVKNSTGATQGGVLGTADCNRFVYTYLALVSTTDYVVGEKAKMASHTTGANNGNFSITAVNSGGNNIVVHNSAGATQGGVAGNALPNRWKYNLPSDPTASSNVALGDTMVMLGHTNVLNDGTFVVKDITSSTVVVYNESGVAQAGAPGNVYTARKLVKFASDQSAVYSTSSFIEMAGCSNGIYNYADNRAPFQVLQINRGGGANFNVVISNATSLSQSSPAGFVQAEMRSLFSASPSLAASVVGLTPNLNINGSTTSLTGSTVSQNAPVMLYITSMQLGDPRDFSVFLA